MAIKVNVVQTRSETRIVELNEEEAKKVAIDFLQQRFHLRLFTSGVSYHRIRDDVVEMVDMHKPAEANSVPIREATPLDYAVSKVLTAITSLEIQEELPLITED